ncbi:YceD family protein [Candidatus Planktophila dulcis]|uniref:YceD family protein n=1 Tax=Candidatus Planktophila dulcis TaxID=1884914 RepID=UPI001CC0D58F|nr:YceD family protein [Candidatus Planktophila dulcis]
MYFRSSMLMTKSANPFLLNTHELPRRTGEMKEYQLDIESNARIGVPLIAVPEGDVIEVDVRLESVTEGVLLSADIYAVAIGECIRCLDPVEQVVERKIQELYRYEPTNEKGRKKRPEEDDVDLDMEDELQMEGDVMNLEIPIIDAIILALPVNPLCSEECLGLCPDCGEKWEKLPEGHAHEVVDARWSGLEKLDFGN